MKTGFLRSMLAFFFLFGASLILTQCESGFSEMEGKDSLDALVSDRSGNGTGTVDVCTCLTDQFDWEELSTEEAAALRFMVEEEKLARDIYLAMNAEYDQQVFSNISRSEQRHMDMVRCLLEKYGLSDPTEGKATGQFAAPNLQALYDLLLSQGMQSVTDAFWVGATIEDVDIFDLENHKAEADNIDVKAVFDELLRGSRNHLRAFVRNLEWNGLTYKAQYIDQSEMEIFLDGPVERGSALCGGCNGSGPGAGGHGNGVCDGNGPGKGSGPNGNGNNGGSGGRNGGRNGGGNGGGR